jgi:hypothetical protein
MTEIGYTLSSEEFGPRELVRFAERAETVGFDFLLHIRPLSPLDRRAGTLPVRVGNARRGRVRDRAGLGRDGYTHVYFHQVGPDQEQFIEFAEREPIAALR